MARSGLKKLLFRCTLAIVAVSAALWVAFRPAVANHFGYALPTARGLPCRLHYRGRDYDNDEQCGGINRSGWMIWHDAQEHLASGGQCMRSDALRRQQEWPLHQVGSIGTLFGPRHAVFVAVREQAAPTWMVLYVQDAGCYRPYILSGGP